MLKSVSFDLWETLITNPPEAGHAQKQLRVERIARILREHGLAVTDEQVEHAHRTSWHRCQDLYWSADRDVSCRTQVEHFLEELELPVANLPMDALEDAYARAAIDALPSIVPGAPEVIAELKDRGYSIGLISNTGRTPGYALREILQALGLASLIDAMVFSNEHGACKPQQSIFETLRQALDVSFDEMVFVGDNLYVDVYGAQRCGIPAVHFIPAKRGAAVAAPVDHNLEIIAEATIRDLRELPPIINAWASSASSDPSSSMTSGASARE